MPVHYVVSGHDASPEHQPVNPAALPQPSGASVIARGAVEQLERELRAGIEARTRPGFGANRALKAAFKAMDADGSDAIDFDEFCSSLERFGLHIKDRGLKGGAGGMNTSIARALFDRFDSDGSGTISYVEVRVLRIHLACQLCTFCLTITCNVDSCCFPVHHPWDHSSRQRCCRGQRHRL
jgi:hypothetical protein